MKYVREPMTFSSSSATYAAAFEVRYTHIYIRIVTISAVACHSFSVSLQVLTFCRTAKPLHIYNIPNSCVAKYQNIPVSQTGPHQLYAITQERWSRQVCFTGWQPITTTRLLACIYLASVTVKLPVSSTYIVHSCWLDDRECILPVNQLHQFTDNYQSNLKFKPHLHFRCCHHIID